MEKKLADLNFSNRLYKTSPALFHLVKPTPLENPTLLHLNLKLLNELGLSSEITKNPSFLRFINGDLEFEGTLILTKAQAVLIFLAIIGNILFLMVYYAYKRKN